MGVSDDEERETDLHRMWGLLMLPGYMPELVLERPGWQHRAACRGEPVGTFFPSGRPVRAQVVCSECPVRVECADYALADPELVGVWGGLSTVERRRLRRDAA